MSRQYHIIDNEIIGKLIYFEENGKRICFGEHEGNSDYAEYLRFTEWVEAGNDPDEFWTQSEEI